MSRARKRWRPISTVGLFTDVIFARLEDDYPEWQASGTCFLLPTDSEFKEGGVWIDYIKNFVVQKGGNRATHWRPMYDDD